MKPLDHRLNAFRPELADAALEGRVEAARFVKGKAMRVAAPLAPVRNAPSDRARLDTEALCGEPLTVFETTPDGWAWAQLGGDCYVGWIPANTLSGPGPEPTHKVTALRTFVFSEPDIKSPPLAALPFGANVFVNDVAEDKNAKYALIPGGGAVVIQHLTRRDEFQRDWISVAEKFLGTPYLWGGKSSLGIDCSGLVQLALGACGISAPRDTDMQESALGALLPMRDGLPALNRGDLIFWKRHVGFMQDSETLLHANSHVMAVGREPLSEAIRRIESRNGGQPTGVRRII